jgi:CheY-like chemotaxis protein
MRTVSKRIIIVDDVDMFIQKGKSLLNREDFDILTVTSGHEALFRSREYRPDLVILHLYMPDMNGDAVCREIKNDPMTEQIPVLIITAKGDDEHRQSAKEAGCDGCIAKPIQPEEIIPAVEKHLGVPPRRYRRSKVSIQCRLTDEDGERGGVILNITPEGAFIKTDPAPWAGDIVKVGIYTDDADGSIPLQAAVRWSREGGGAYPGGAGCEFLGAPPEAVQWLRDLIASNDTGMDGEAT